MSIRRAVSTHGNLLLAVAPVMLLELELWTTHRGRPGDPGGAFTTEQRTLAAVSVEGEPTALPAGVDLSAYRIVQEALTNTLKDAGPANAHVAVRYHRHDLAIEIADTGAGAAPGPGRGRGPIGMRERVQLFGGELHASDRPGGGLRRPSHTPARRLPAVTVRVLLADDERLVSAGFRMLLKPEPGIAVVGEAADGAQAVEAAARTHPDVILMDIPCAASTGSRPPAESSPGPSPARASSS